MGGEKRARGWTCAMVHKFVQDYVFPYDPSSFPMQEAGDTQGKRCEASVVLPPRAGRGPYLMLASVLIWIPVRVRPF